MKSVATTDAENRRIVLIDLLIGVGIPVLQMIVREWARSLIVNRLFTWMQSRVRRFDESLHHI
jgi:hypothetical protein